VVTLGPPKMIAPFGRVASRLTPAEQRRLAFDGVPIGTVAVLLGGGLGSLLASNWGISTPIPTICTGLIFFRVATRTVLAQYELAMPETLADDTVPSPFRIALWMVTRHGIAVVVALLSLFPDDITRVIQVVAALLVVLACGPDSSVWRRARCSVGGVGAAYPFDRVARSDTCGQSARMTGRGSPVMAA
jgi:multiple antibiotic resistance protein